MSAVVTTLAFLAGMFFHSGMVSLARGDLKDSAFNATMVVGYLGAMVYLLQCAGRP